MFQHKINALTTIYIKYYIYIKGFALLSFVGLFFKDFKKDDLELKYILKNNS